MTEGLMNTPTISGPCCKCCGAPFDAEGAGARWPDSRGWCKRCAQKDREAIMQFFNHRDGVEIIFAQVHDLAETIQSLPRSAERTVALRKLLECQDSIRRIVG